MEKGKKTLRLPIMLCLLFLAGFIVWTWLSSRNSAYNFVGFLFGEGCLILFFLGGVFWTERKGMPAYALLCGVTILLTLGNAYQAIFSANGSIKGYPLFLAAALGLAIASYFFFCGQLDRTGWLFKLMFGLVAAALLLNAAFGRGSAVSPQSRLWIRIGGISIQPMEYIKVGLIVMAAMAQREKKRAMWFFSLGIICLACCLWLHDLGTGSVILALLVLDSYLLLDNRLLSLGLIAVCVIGFAIAVHKLPYAAQRLANTGKAWESINSEQGASQQAMVIRGIIMGGFRGSGLEARRFIYSIPMATNDAALAGIQSIYGVSYITLVFLCYGMILVQAHACGGYSPTTFLILSQMGLLVLTQVVLNYLGALDFLPFTGINAPGISSGGSSLTSFGILIGTSLAGLCPKLSRETRVPSHWYWMREKMATLLWNQSDEFHSSQKEDSIEADEANY